ncbi:MAG: PSD1 and planctomycete cytochrome C domain-containing protein [Pirellulales bacterium]
MAARRSTAWLLGIAVGIAAFSSLPLRPSPVSADAPPPVDYARDIKPVLKERCYACHGALQQKSGLRLDTGAAIRQGGEGGQVIALGDPATSELLARVKTTDAATRMPPEGHPLTNDQIDKLRRWIEQGAASPEGEAPEADPRNHWSFRPPVKAPLPVPPSGRVFPNPIDAFIAQKLEAEKLPPRPLADKATLLRRVTLDLIGLPPTPEELQAFEADSSADAYDKVVERLLNDSRHGERWARHWMDVWRYADWHGRRHVPDVWNSAPQVWRWRDWIVQSLNADHGYDRMVQRMLAGDELAGDDPQSAVATAYLVRNWYALNPNDWMRANVEHASKAFLGLTVHCAHCHDHKYDPIAQDDYFQLRAMFEPIGVRQDRAPGEADPGPFQEYEYSVLRKIQRLGSVQVFDKKPDSPTWFYTGGDERNRVADRGSMKPSLPAFLGGDRFPVQPVELPAVAWYPALRPEIGETILAERRAAIASFQSQVAATRDEVAKALPPLLEKVVQAEQALALAEQQPGDADRSRPLAGRQSLVLHAGVGRRAIQNRLAKLPRLETGASISFRLQIIDDAHVNFQLAKDLVAGLTASFVGFEKGRILAYQPGGFVEFQAGAYDVAGDRRFHVSLTLDRDADRCWLTVTSLADERKLVDRAPIALHGWNPAELPNQGISSDARPGTRAVIDEVRVTAPPDAAGMSPVLWECGFEPPAFREGGDIDGIDGWQVSSFSVSPGTSMVASSLGDGPRAAAQRTLAAARRAAAAHELRAAALLAKIEAAQAELASVEARLTADQARYGAAKVATDSIETLQRSAAAAHRTFEMKKAEAEVLTFDQQLAAAEAKPASDANREKELAAAAKLLAAARTSLAKAQEAAAGGSTPNVDYPPVGPTYPKTSTGRRTALARWLTNRQHPLTARVAVNHIWLRHFHSPLVASVFDFGLNGARPTHPELLDWLAVELMESGWSMKHLHRLIVTSEAYRRVSSTGDSAAYARDPENRQLWRMNVGRMEAEVVRDSLLFVAGRLDPRMGGQELENSEALKTTRRSLYYSCHPELDGKSPFGALFDAPEPADCYRRTRSIVPQQSLALANSDLVQESSRLVAEQIWKSLETQGQATNASFIAASYRRVLGRSPTAAESAVCASFLETPADGATSERTREGLVRVLLNHNDFIAIR